MITKPGPDGLLSRFNKAAKSLLGATAVGMMLLGGSASHASSLPPPDIAPSTQPDDSVNYEYIGNRTIRLTGTINTKTAIEVIEKMLELSRKDPKADIELRINSGGGEVNAGFAIYDVMKSLPNDVRTVCEGNAQSMAAFLLSAGTQGKRFAYPNCEIMYHQPSWGETGQITDMQITTAQGNVSKDRMIKLLSRDSGWPERVIRDLLERNFYPTTQEAKEMGFIDHLIEDPNPDPLPAPKTQLPDNFCANRGRLHMELCRPAP